MQDILNSIYGKVDTFLKLKRELEDLTKRFKTDESFHKIAGEIIPENLRKGLVGYEFLKHLLGERQANKLHIHDPELKRMKIGEGI